MAHRLKESLEENPSTTAKLLPSCPTTVGDEVLAMLKWWESWRIMSQDPLCMFWDVIKTSLKFPPVFVEKNMTSSMQRMFHLYKIHSKKTGCLLLNHGFSPPVSCYYSWAPAVFPCSLSRTSRWLLVEVRLFFGCAVCAFERWQSWKIPWVLDTFDHISSVRVSGKETQFKYRPWGRMQRNIQKTWIYIRRAS